MHYFCLCHPYNPVFLKYLSIVAIHLSIPNILIKLQAANNKK